MMTEYKARRPKVAPPHPGGMMREILTEHVKVPMTEAARRMGVSRAALYDVLEGRAALTADMAVRFGKLIDSPIEAFLGMQTAHELWLAEEKLAGLKIAPVGKAA
jgi:addiction module HigA family antidote